MNADDVVVRRALREWPSIAAPPDVGALLRRAEHHGLAGIVGDALVSAGVAVDSSTKLREVARELDHAAHLATLREIDASFAAAGLVGVPLKGALLGERYYPRPAARVTGDIDLLVAERELDAASGALARLGYAAAVGVAEERFRREHHHVHLRHPAALPLELHFHAYRGFGGTLRSEDFISRSLRYREFSALRVLSAADEIVYLAVHAAAHRFGRWSWLFDLRLLLDRVDTTTLSTARSCAIELGFARPLALAARLLHEIFGVDRARTKMLGELGPVRGALARGLLHAPANPVARAASWLAYSTALCPDATTSARWVAAELVRKGRTIVGDG